MRAISQALLLIIKVHASYSTCILYNNTKSLQIPWSTPFSELLSFAICRLYVQRSTLYTDVLKIIFFRLSITFSTVHTLYMTWNIFLVTISGLANALLRCRYKTPCVQHEPETDLSTLQWVPAAAAKHSRPQGWVWAPAIPSDGGGVCVCRTPGGGSPYPGGIVHEGRPEVWVFYISDAVRVWNG